VPENNTVTLFSLFVEGVQKAGDNAAIRQGENVVSHVELYDRVLARARQLGERLEQPGGVAILLNDSVDFLASFFACMVLGRAAAPIERGLPTKRLKTLLREPEFAGVLTDDYSLEELARCPVISPKFETVGKNRALALATHPDAEFYWGLTSGTTGEPKLIARTHSSWIASFEAAEQVFDFQPSSTILIPGPLHHSLFLYGSIHALCRGHTIILPAGPFRADRLSDTQTTHLYAVPFMLNKLLAARAELPGLRMIFCGGAKLDEALRERCERQWPDADIVEFYGATETSFITYHSTIQPGSAGSVGRLFPGVELRICDEHGAQVPRGIEGELFVSGPMVFARYVGGETADSWISVGDLGYLDDEDCLQLTGRTSRTINSKGLKIQPELIEHGLSQRPEIRRAAVVGLPDPLRGAAPAAIVEFEADMSLSRKTLAAFCRAEFGPQYCPRRYFVSEQLPQTSSGKIAVAAIRESLIAGDNDFRELL
jgi:long-chain acyl-CoA synthetase